ncbi:MAG: transposase [Blastocatellia bacterium]|nr:transposase [Blastocatellia bacterium]MBA3609715.1 transposase [Chthoniobacterales bacterium]
MSFTKLDYCQYLLSSQINYTLTNMADHLNSFSHDTINRYLKGEKITPRLLFEQVEPMLEQNPEAYLIFDDTVLDKRNGPSIEVTRKQWSGNEGSVIRGIGLVSCVYVNPTTERFWVIDYRIFDPDADGLTKLDHVREMLGSVSHRGVGFGTVLMDAWYATKDLMLLIEGIGKKYYCPLKSNRSVDDSRGERPYRRVDGLEWGEEELEWGKPIKIKGFPREHKVKLFRVVVHSRRTEWIVTNDLPSRDSVQEAQKARGLRWKIEEFHREAKQLTGIERCQCRKGRIQRNHVACALLVWSRLKHLAYHDGRTVYQIKHGLLRDYLVQQLKNPGVRMVLA